MKNLVYGEREKEKAKIRHLTLKGNSALLFLSIKESPCHHFQSTDTKFRQRNMDIQTDLKKVVVSLFFCIKVTSILNYFVVERQPVIVQSNLVDQVAVGI